MRLFFDIDRKLVILRQFDQMGGWIIMAETLPKKRKRVLEIIAILEKEFPDARCMLDFTNPLELLVATILAAQCTDERVNQVTSSLFKKYRLAKDYAQADIEEFEQEIRPTGFFKNKSKAIISCCKTLVEEHQGKVPPDMDKLTKLSGVGRKTANVVLGNCFGQPAIIVDTHVRRLAGRIGLSGNTDPDKIEFDLRAIVPQDQWTRFSHLLAFHGRAICKAPKPLCYKCPINHICPYEPKTEAPKTKPK